VTVPGKRGVEMSEQDPRPGEGGVSEESARGVPDDRVESAGPDRPAGIDPEGPPAQVPDDRKGATRPVDPEVEGGNPG